MNIPSTPSFKTIKRPSVVEEIIDIFKNKLINGEIKPGEKLPPESQLMAQLGIGRTALRESMKMLSALGVIEVRQGDGTYVVEGASSKSLDPMVFAILLESGMSRELLELRTLLEIGYCQLAAEKANPNELAYIEEAANEFENKITDKDLNPDELTRADLEFHFRIIEVTRNPFIIRISRAVEELFFSSIRNTISKMEGQRWGVEGHRNIFNAIKANDAIWIKEAVIISLDRWSKDLEVKDLNKNSS